MRVPTGESARAIGGSGLTNRPHPSTPAIRTAKRGSSKPARSIVRGLRVIDEAPWGRFSAPKDQAPWYYRSLVTGYRGTRGPLAGSKARPRVRTAPAAETAPEALAIPTRGCDTRVRVMNTRHPARTLPAFRASRGEVPMALASVASSRDTHWPDVPRNGCRPIDRNPQDSREGAR